jgi:photosystem II stability/assembly factor-like uncharacterized protein
MSKFIEKLALLFFLLVVPLSLFAQGTWEKRELPTNQFLRSVFFTDSLYGWIAGDSGIILHTIDGGNSWVLQNTQTENEITDVFFLDRNQGWASANNYLIPPYGTTLFKTINGGTVWEKYLYPQEDIFITCIEYRDSLTGWMGGKPHAIVKTTDGGTTWAQATVDTSILAFFPVLTIQFYNDQYGYASGGMFDIAGVIWRTSDGGDTWYAMDASDAPADEVHAIHMFDSIRVMGAGGDPDFGYGVGMIRTFDGGVNWEYDELTIQGYATDIDFRNATEAWAPLGPRQKMIYSLDAGTTWTPIIPPDSAAIFDVIFPDSLHGYAVGRDGAFLKYHPPVIPSSGYDLVGVPYQWQLFQNSPNPVQNQTTFRFGIPMNYNQNKIRSRISPNGVQVRIFDHLGRMVYQSTDEYPLSGIHEINADLSPLGNGVYFFRLFMEGDPVSEAGTRHLIIAR